VANVDIDKLQESLEKMASTINRSARHTEKIPELKKKVEETTTKVVELSTEMRGMNERVTKVEGKVDEGHACQIPDTIESLKQSQRETSQKIETDVQHGIKQSGEINLLKKDAAAIGTDIDEIKKAPRRMFYGLVGIVFTILTGAGGAIWFLAELSKDVEFERTQRTEQFDRIEKHIKVVGRRADPTPIRQDIDALERTIEVSNGHEQEYGELCVGMPPYEKRVFKNSLIRRGKRIPISCLE